MFHRALENGRQRNAALSAVMDMTPYGLVVFDTRAQTLMVNKPASRMFGTGEGLTMVNGRLHAAVPEAHARLENALSMAVHGALGAVIPAPDPVIVPRNGNSHPYHVVFSRLQFDDRAHDLPDGSAVMAIIHEDWPSGSKYLPFTLQYVYKLTASEVRVCQAMLVGKSLSESAATLNISRNTAKTHLTRIFSKTGVRSQAELLRLLSTGIRPKLPILNTPSTGGSRARR